MTDPFKALSTYEKRHLPRHLATVGLVDELHRLLSMEREPGDDALSDGLQLTGRSTNAWYAAVVADSDQRRYLDHVEIAAHAAEERTAAALRSGRSPDDLVWEFHYALAASSVRNISAHVPVRLLASLLRTGLVGADAALTHVRQIADPRQQAEGLRSLVALVDDETAAQVAGEALAAISAVEDEYWRVAELGQLVAELPASLLPTARLISENFTDPYYSSVAQAMLTLELEIDPELRDRLASLQFHREGIVSEEYDPRTFREEYLAEYAQRGAHAVRNLRELVRDRGPEAVGSPQWLAEAYASLLDDSDDYLEPAITAAGEIGGDAAHTELVRAVAVRLVDLGDQERAQALVADTVPDEHDRLLIRCDLAAAGGAPVEPGELAAVPDPWMRLKTWRALLPVLEDRAGAASGLLTDEGDDLAADRLVTVAPHVDGASWDRAVHCAAVLTDDQQRMRAHGALAARGVVLGRDGALALLSDVRDEHWYGDAVDAVVPALLRTGRVEEAVELATSAPRAHRRAALLAACGTEDARRTAREIATSLAVPAARARALVLVAQVLDEMDLLDHAVAAALVIDGGERMRADGLAGVAKALAAAGRLDHALDLVEEIGNEHSLATALVAIADHSDADGLRRMLGKARSISARRARGWALTAVARRAAALESSPVEMHDRWREALQTLARGGREEFLHDVRGLLPVAEAFGGAAMLERLARSSQRIMRWWP